jgi:hypothetical protein
MPVKYAQCLIGFGAVPKRYAVNDNQTIVIGSPLVFSGGKLSLAADAAAVTTVAGFAMEAITTTTAAATDIIAVDVNPFSVYNMPYLGSATPAVGVAYDWYSDGVFDSDDSTGGIFMVVGNVDTTASTADVVMLNRFICAG